MNLVIKPLKPGSEFAAEVVNLDLGKSLKDADFSIIRDAFYKYAVLVLRDQNINDDQQIAFSERFGALETSLGFDQYGGVTRPEISRISNVGDDNKIRPHDHEKSRYHLTRFNETNIVPCNRLICQFVLIITKTIATIIIKTTMLE